MNCFDQPQILIMFLFGPVFSTIEVVLINFLPNDQIMKSNILFFLKMKQSQISFYLNKIFLRCQSVLTFELKISLV